ncbi:M3 family metallopeptidase [Sphingomonas sp.]|uniref:M3 family metallopeptidase n=1 Tax=Sphingomonas sp. TaxID=28214 RepID=UPI0025D00A35|nr:M3 family metallopeptidase [Sphingomonas sp.]
MNSLLDPLQLPDFDRLTPEAIAEALDEALDHHRAVVADLVHRRPTSFAEAWLPLERAQTRLDALWQAASHLRAVADTPALRDAHAKGQALLTENSMAVGQNRALYELLRDIALSPEMLSLADEDKAALDHAIRSFRLAGVALEPDARARFREISLELSDLGTAFGSAVLDATEAWYEHITDAERLAGLPEPAKAMCAAAAAARSLEGWVVTLQQPSIQAVLTFAEDRALRASVYQAAGTRASDQGPHAGQFDNSARIARTLELRREAAMLLGYADSVEHSLATKMAPDGDGVLAFLRDLASRAKTAAARDLAELQDFAKDQLGIDTLEPWDVGFAADKLREARYAINEPEIMTYFPAERVMAGWERLLERLFGIRLARREDVMLYHPDAIYFDVADEDGTQIAGLYLDLHARAGKHAGAWMAEARPRLDDSKMSRVPVAFIVCNFAPTGSALPPLLSHDDIVTLLHETGHALHHMFTRVNRPSVAGTAGFEWDAVELPSQLMEDFAWDRDVLTAMSGHVETGAPLPPDLFDQLVAARHFQSGLQLLRQIEFSMFDIVLHQGTQGCDPMAVLERVRDEVAVTRPPDWHRFPHAFQHIFSGGYAAGYYSYLWAEVLAADGFERFEEAGLVDRATGRLLRREVLERGATRPAAESFRAFRGRDPDPAAILRRRGLAGTPAG